MRVLQVLCIIGFAGLVLARPQVQYNSRMPFSYKYLRNHGVIPKRPLGPLGVLHNQYGFGERSKTLTKISSHHRQKDCKLCPPASDISPCMCKCYCNATTCLADINCAGPILQEASELEKILSITSYPVPNYSGLLIQNTLLNGAITRFMLGTTVSFNEISIHHNGFTYVDKHAFNNTGPLLKKLYLNNNEIQQINWCLLDMPYLRFMDISHNMLMFIPGDALHSDHLRFLNLSYNELGDIGINAFKGLTKLQRLDLSNNALDRLGSSSLAFNLIEPVHLSVNLSHNQINSVADTAISGVKVISIDLKHNQLDTLKEEVFKPFIDSTDGRIHIDVAGNPIACDCNLKWLVQNSTLASCFDDFPVCDSTLSSVTVGNLGDC